MTEEFFDTLARTFATGFSRRNFLKALGIAGASLVSSSRISRGSADALVSPRPQTDLVRAVASRPLTKAQLAEIKAAVTSISTLTDYVKEAADLNSNVTACTGRGFSEAQCKIAAGWCTFNNLAISALLPGWVSAFQLLNFLSTDCGNGECYQCCHMPGTNYKCHTSFVGYPVLNCNPVYYPGSSAAGLTFITASNAQPGDYCLFTAQTCEHIPMCHHDYEWSRVYLTDPRAIARRAHSTAEQSVWVWKEYLSEFVTGALSIIENTSHSLAAANTTENRNSFVSFASFLTGRGRKGWRQQVLSDSLHNWSDSVFRITNGNGEYLEEPTRLNAIIQLGVIRLLSCIPNFEKRLAYVESRVWTDEEKQTYLQRVGDPDEVLLGVMSPEGLAVLRKIQSLQDYRLLAVPLPDEPPVPNLFNGVQLGQPPIVRASFKAAGSTGVVLTLAVIDPEQTSVTGLSLPIAVDWGDGQITQHQVPPTTQNLTVEHRYARGGRYRVYTLVENETGLRGISVLIVETTTRDSISIPTSPLTPTILTVNTVSVTQLPYSMKMYFSLLIVTQENQRIVAGRSAVATGTSSGATDVNIGDIVGFNSARLTLNRLIIAPTIIGQIPTYVAFTVACALQGLTLSVFSTAQKQYVDVNVPLTPNAIQVFLEGSNTPLPVSAMTTDSQGRVLVPCLRRASSGGALQKTARIEVPITAQMFDRIMLGSPAAEEPVGANVSYVELRPDYYEQVIGSKMFLPVVRR